LFHFLKHPLISHSQLREQRRFTCSRGMARGRVALQFLVMRLILDVYIRECARTDILHVYTVAGNSDDIVLYLRIRGAVLRGLD